jgi:choline dehydrogenase
MVESARNVGVRLYENPNGRMMESGGGTAITDVRLRHGRRLSVFRSYTYPLMDQPNLTVLTSALVTRVTFQGTRATGVEIRHRGVRRVINATTEIVLSLGAINTPKVLMQSGVGDAAEMRRHGIPLVQHLPGVGQGYQDHVAVGVMWEGRQPLLVRNNGSEATFTWKSDSAIDTPDLQTYIAERPVTSAEMMAQYNPPAASWTLFAGLMRPKSRGAIRLTGPNPDDPVEINGNHLGHADDMKALLSSVELCREIGNSLPLRSFSRREIMPGNLKGSDLVTFIRGAATGCFHASATAKMGRDAMAVVDSQLRVYGIYGLRIADASIMPRVTTGNTMAPCVIIGERAAEMLRTAHRCHF